MTSGLSEHSALAMKKLCWPPLNKSCAAEPSRVSSTPLVESRAQDETSALGKMQRGRPAAAMSNGYRKSEFILQPESRLLKARISGVMACSTCPPSNKLTIATLSGPDEQDFSFQLPVQLFNVTSGDLSPGDRIVVTSVQTSLARRQIVITQKNDGTRYTLGVVICPVGLG